MTADVPCNGCRECCKGPDRQLMLGSEDILSGVYQTEIKGCITYLANKPNGDCVYLGDEGCTIHATRPRACRVFDCRDHLANPGMIMRVRVAALRVMLKDAIESGD